MKDGFRLSVLTNRIKCILSTDQRGVARPQGIACDVGAFEFEQSGYYIYLPLAIRNN